MKKKSKDPVITTEKRLIKYWDDVQAKEWYRLSVYVFEDGELDKDSPYTVATGNSDWARREARHYNISIREED